MISAKLALRSGVAMAAAVACFASADPARAQEGADAPAADDAGNSSEIIVTARKQDELLREVPVPVAVLGTEQIASSNQIRLQDYFSKIPGVSLVLAGEAQAPIIAIRGLVSAADQGSQTSTIVIDDVPFGSSINPGTLPLVADIDPGDVQQIEVLRGPQGTLYGANSLGGLVKYVTIDPVLGRFSARAQAGAYQIAHGDAGYTLRGAVNVPVSENLAIRGSAAHGHEPGYVDNLRTGAKDVNDGNFLSTRLSALWEPTAELSVKAGGFYQRRKRFGGSRLNFTAGSPSLTQNVIAQSGQYDRESKGATANISANVDGVDLTSISGFTVDGYTATNDISNFAAFFPGTREMLAVLDIRTEKISQELRASIPVADGVEWMVGGFYTHETIDLNLDWLGSQTAGGALSTLIFRADQPATYREYAAFSNVTVKFSDQFDIQLGGRHSWISQTFATNRTGPGSQLFFRANPFILPLARTSESSTTYLVAPRFKVSPQLMVYGRATSGYRPGGINIGCEVRAGAPCNYKPDRTDSFEIGSKGSLMNGLIGFDVSLFSVTWKDIQILVRSPGFAFTGNVGRARSRGVEFSADVRPWRGMTLSGWVTYLEAELTESTPAETGFFGAKGDRLPFSSKWSGSISADQTFDLSSTAKGFIGGSVDFVGQRFDAFPATAATVRQTYDAYQKVDLRAGVKFEKFRVELYVNNLFDARGVTKAEFALQPGGAYLPNALFVINPRTFGANVTAEFW